MSRLDRSERLASSRSTARPKRRAARTDFFKFQLAANPCRVEQSDLKRALEESLVMETKKQNGVKNKLANSNNNLSSKSRNSISARLSTTTNSGNLSSRNSKGQTMNNSLISDSSASSRNSSSTTNHDNHDSTSLSGNDLSIEPLIFTSATKNNNNGHQNFKRTRSSKNSSNTTDDNISTPNIQHSPNKRPKLARGLNEVILKGGKCDSGLTGSGSNSACPLVDVSKAIRTYSRSQSAANITQLTGQPYPAVIDAPIQPKTSTPINGNSISVTDKSTSLLVLSKAIKISKSTQTAPETFAPKPRMVVLIKQPQQPVMNNISNSKPALTSSKHPPITQPLPVPTTPQQQQQQQLTLPLTITPDHDQFLKSKRESKNYAYAKMTALKVNASKQSSAKKESSPTGILHNNGANKCSKTTDNYHNKCTISPGSATTNVSVVVSKSKLNTQKQDNKTKSSQFASPGSSDKTIKINPIKSNGKEDHAKSNRNPSLQISNPASRDISQAITDSSASDHLGRLIDECSKPDTLDLSTLTDASSHKASKKRSFPQRSWSLLGIPEDKFIYTRDDEPPKRLICYPAIKHIEGDVIQVRDSVLLRSGARKTDLPYIAKVCSFWKDGDTGNIMMSLLWYYRPEHTEGGRKPHHLPDEIFASRHRDVDSVECIEDKCYVLTFNEYCRYRRRCRMEQANTSWSLKELIMPDSSESYPRQHRIPDNDVNPELVFCCRQVYDSRTRRLVKNPYINTKYGHI